MPTVALAAVKEGALPVLGGVPRGRAHVTTGPRARRRW